MKKIMRKLKNIFGNIYWYLLLNIRINDKTQIRAYKLLTNDYDGIDSLIGSLIVKTTHMLYILRKDLYEANRYIFSSYIKNNKDKKCIQFLINKELANLDKTKEVYLGAVKIHDGKKSIKINYKGIFENNLFKIYEITPKLNGYYKEVVYEEGELVIKEKPHYLYLSDEVNAKVIIEEPNFVFDYKNIEIILDKIKNYIIKTYEKCGISYENYIYDFTGCINIEPEDYKQLDDFVKRLVKGRITAYHSLWKFRKELIKFYNYDVYSEYSLDSYTKNINDKWDYINAILKKESQCWWI